MVKEFKLGNTVKWKSSAGGTWKEKQGEVVHVVRANVRCPDRKWLESRYSASASPIDGYKRDHESYIVRVPSGTKAKDKLYWPRVSALELVPEF